MGPPGAGKTTLAVSLEGLLRREIVSLDQGRAIRYRRFGYTAARADRWFEEGGARALHRYESRFEVRALGHELEHRPDALIDASGGVLLQKDPDNEQRLAACLLKAHSVILVLPYAHDIHRSQKEIERRLAVRAETDPGTAEWVQKGGRELLSDLVLVAHEYRSAVDHTFDPVSGRTYTKPSASTTPDHTLVTNCLRTIAAAETHFDSW
ncbi:hypothetical protein ACIPWE_12635 [Streptomyces sp. NPDC090073]|uniref:hypothetical protein n=1 Tax=Streptomyces sp. NPDC090073 TaxID=3365936 RepID=UPI00380C9F6B